MVDFQFCQFQNHILSECMWRCGVFIHLGTCFYYHLVRQKDTLGRFVFLRFYCRMLNSSKWVIWNPLAIRSDVIVHQDSCRPSLVSHPQATIDYRSVRNFFPKNLSSTVTIAHSLHLLAKKIRLQKERGYLASRPTVYNSIVEDSYVFLPYTSGGVLYSSSVFLKLHSDYVSV